MGVPDATFEAPQKPYGFPQREERFHANGIEWRKLTRFLEYPELELSTNLAENSMRPVALGRKNWLRIGSSHAGPKVAAILSVVESCRRLKISVRDYLAAVLPGLADLPIWRLPALTPSTWATSV